MSPLAKAAKAEVERLHAYLVDLFTRQQKDLAPCASAFASDLSMIAPDGSSYDRTRILANLANATAAPGFRIRIYDVQSIWEDEAAVLLQYTEEQYRDGETSRRRSSALFTIDRNAPSGVVWRYLHETWQETKEMGGNVE
jgi:hypothetical protein